MEGYLSRSKKNMSFAKEPPFKHGALGRTAVVLVNLGTPDEPTSTAVSPVQCQSSDNASTNIAGVVCVP